MSQLQPVRGTHDVLPEEMRRHRAVIDTARHLAGRYGYREMMTPIFEFTQVFKRTLGEASDVVTKEMYTFAMHDGEELTLRPEATAGIARALISGGLAQSLPLKFFTYGPMFRYERPQKGRQRQFNQIDVELLGVPQPLGDIEIIALAADILKSLGVLDNTTLELNTLGDPESRQGYRSALVEYFQGERQRLSPESIERLVRNPLRILDSKDRGDQAVVKDAPIFADYLNQASLDYYAEVKAGLSSIGVRYVENPRLVRGLDYYTHTAFEFKTTALGAQDTVLGGGRYDGLVGMLGGTSTAGTGWAAGIERLALLMTEPPAEQRPIAVVPIGPVGEAAALKMAQKLRDQGLSVDLGYTGNLSKRMKRANKINARCAIMLGEDELARGTATVRDLDTGEQATVDLDHLIEHLALFR